MESVVAGARKFLIKPLNPEALINAIQTVAEESDLKPSA
jgi:DNA-binding NarL/FixJ family response regulator